MPNAYFPFYVFGKAGKRRQDGLRTGELRFLVVEKEDGRRHHHSLMSLKRAELGEIVDKLGYKEDRKVMKEALMAAEESEEAVKVYLESMRDLIFTHFDETLEEIKNSVESAGEGYSIGEVLLVPPHLSLDEVVDWYLAEQKKAAAEKIENSNNEKEENHEEEEEEDESTVEEGEDVDIE